MSNDANLHAGHRKRLTQKFLTSANTLSDHELIELLLFYSIPRRDTNPLAHRLLRAFGSIDGLLKAKPQEIKSVTGIGESSATQILVVGELLARARALPNKKQKLSTPEQLDNYLPMLFKEFTEEKAVVILLDKSYNKISELTYKQKQKLYVSIDLNELVSTFAVLKPKHMIVAHNHTGEKCFPSNEDLTSTKKMNMLCDLHGVNLIDHVIVKGKETFSFRKNGLMDMIKDEKGIYNILTHIKED